MKAVSMPPKTPSSSGSSTNGAAPHARALFGTDGIRGVANADAMTPELALKLGKAVTFVAGRGKSHMPRILIGKDTRLSGYMLETAIAAGVCSMGGKVLLCGPIPTPAVAHLTISMRADAGLVISASHNPYQDNGIKIFGSNGFKLPDEQEAEIERLMANDTLMGMRPTGPGIGRAEKLEDSRGRYVVFAKTTFPRELSMEGMRIVVDAAHGAAYRVAPLVFQELGANVTCLGVKPNGVNINKDCGALHPDNVRAEVVRRRAQVGIALDGDADRLIVVDEKGQIVDGDAVMAMWAQEMIRRGELKKKTVRRDGDEQPRPRARARARRGEARSDRGRRSLRRRGDAEARLQPRGRAVGAPRVPRPRDDRRRHRGRAPGPRDHARRAGSRSRSSRRGRWIVSRRCSRT